jgi:AcrR family transcriptional regulator
MKETSSGYEFQGRTRQKARTRAVLLAATRELLAEGITPAVEQAAERAEISASTAYRYFPNRRALLVATYPEIEAQSLLGPDPPSDPGARLDLVTKRLGDLLLANEPELRTALRLSLESPAERDSLLLRGGRALGWIEEALEPLRAQIGGPKVHRLALAIRATLGPEPLVWLTDVGGLSSEEAVELMRSSAGTLLRAALEEHPGERPRRNRGGAVAESRGSRSGGSGSPEQKVGDKG